MQGGEIDVHVTFTTGLGQPGGLHNLPQDISQLASQFGIGEMGSLVGQKQDPRIKPPHALLRNYYLFLAFLVPLEAVPLMPYGPPSPYQSRF